MERLSTAEALKALPDGDEKMVKEATYSMTQVETENLEETLGRHLPVFQKEGEPLGKRTLYDIRSGQGKQDT